MSTTSKITLLLCSAFTVGTVYYVHKQQTITEELMRDGVVKDMERQEMRRIKNMRALQEQIELTKSLKHAQELETRAAAAAASTNRKEKQM